MLAVADDLGDPIIECGWCGTGWSRHALLQAGGYNVQLPIIHFQGISAKGGTRIDVDDSARLTAHRPYFVQWLSHGCRSVAMNHGYVLRRVGSQSVGNLTRFKYCAPFGIKVITSAPQRLLISDSRNQIGQTWVLHPVARFYHRNKAGLDSSLEVPSISNVH